MNTFIIGAIGALAAAGVTLASPTAASATESLPPVIAHQLDMQAAEFTMTEAKRRRLEYMQMEAARSQGYGRRGYGRGYERGPGYGYRDGYGPRGYSRSSREWDRTW